MTRFSSELSIPYAGVSPWAAFNLRRNPFGEPPHEDLPSLIVPEDVDLAAWFGAPRRAVQFIGEAGRGKTAHLHALRRVFPDGPYLYLGEDRPLPSVPAVPRLFLDEAQRLPGRLRQPVFRRVRSIALATHRDLEEELTEAGHEVRTVRIAGMSVRRLQAVLRRRLEWARFGPGEIPGIEIPEAENLVERFGDDLRGVIDHLYEEYQLLVSGSSSRMRAGAEKRSA